MAFNLSNLLATLDSSIAALDSASDLLEVLQAINATNPNSGNGKSQRKYYTSVASLPAADSAMRGMVAVVSTAKVDSANGLYLCTGTAWTEIQDLDSAIPPTQAQGSNFGYTSGGLSNDGSSYYNVIDKFSFTSDGNASDVGDLTVARYAPAGQSSSTNGYNSGGATPPPFATVNVNVIDKFPFVSDGNASDVGDLTVGRYGAAGQSSTAHGYTSGGYATTDVIDKFPFSSDANASDVGNLTASRYLMTGQSSTDNGYSSGGISSNVIDKFPFASNANASDVGDLTAARYGPAGQNSAENGYNSGGVNPVFNVIDKFPFASDANATDVGDLTLARWSSAGQSSTVSGYTSGGNTPSSSNTIDNFPFASDTNASDVGDLTIARRYVAGQQY